MLNIIRPVLPENARIICVSDIHTHWRETKQLLEQCSYKAGEDFLFILGDILERGSDNIGALRYLMELARNERVLVIEGNNDTYVTGLALRYDDDKFLERYAKKQGCFGEMARSLGIEDFTEDTSAKRRAVYEAYKAEIDFIHNLPEVIETEQHIFVHAGILNKPNWEDCPQYDVMLIPRFVDLQHRSEKMVICGHTPTYAIGRANSNLPVMDFSRRIIDIDGGAGVKPAAQINALIISKSGSEYSYDTEFVPIGEPRKAVADVCGRDGWIYADFERHSFTELPAPEDIPAGFITVHCNESGAEGIVPQCMSGSWDGIFHVWGNLNAFPSVQAGEQIWVYAEYGDYCWCITHSGDVGSVPKNAIE